MALQYCIARGAPGAVTPGTRPPRMDHFAFAPVETLHGSFRIAVDYAPSSTVTVLKDSTAHAPMAHVRCCLTSSCCSALRIVPLSLMWAS